MMVVYYADLYLTYFQFLLKSLSQYRADFAITLSAMLIRNGGRLLFLAVIFANIHELAGWSFHDMLLIWSLTVTAQSLGVAFLDVPHRIYWYIRRGQMDRLLVRPLAPLFQIAGESGFNLPSLGGVLIGLAGILTAISGLHDQLPWWGVIYLPVTIISGILIIFSANLLLACLSFWFTNVHSLLETMNWMFQFGLYPANILTLPLQFFFTWVLPYAMIGFYPAAFLLRGDEYRLYGLLAPLLGWLFLGLSLLVWQVAIRHYQSTGS